jgi:integrase
VTSQGYDFSRFRGQRAQLAVRACVSRQARRGSLLLRPETIRRRELYPAMASAGIPRPGPTGELRTFHSFRHTFAKRALESGAQITWLSRHLGHSSLTVTTDVYGHWERAERKRQAELLTGAFGV